MSETKHTPGPWETVGASRIWKTGEVGGAVAIICEPNCKDSRDFQEVWISSKRWSEAMANARLIAAAPELLEACKEALSMMDSLDDADVRCTSGFGYVETALFNAIEKAEGKPCAA